MHQVAFERLKKAIITTFTLIQSDFTKSYTIETNSSNFDNKMILYQENDEDNLYSIAFNECKLHEIEL